MDMEHFWSLKGSGTVNSEQHFFIARKLVAAKLPNPDGDIILAIKEFTPEELLEALWKDELKWSVSTLGILRLLKKLGTLL